MDIHQSPSGRVITAEKGYSAYIPNALPPVIDWTDALVGALSRADFILGNLAREGSRLPNPHLLMRPFIVKEAVLSSKIEGTQVTIGEILAYDSDAPIQRNTDDLQEVQNYIMALEFGLKRLDELPLSLRLIREIHGKLMQGVRGGHATPGEFRRSQNWIGPAGCTLKTAKFVPPPVDHLMDCLGDLESFLHNESLPPLIHIALCHYQFEAIHPFLDGNGRVGRLLITLLLVQKKMLPLPLLYLSAFFEAARDEYYQALFSVSSKGSWHDWLVYFLNAVAVQSESALSCAERINALLDQWKRKMADLSSSTVFDTIDRFATNPYLTVNQVAKNLGVAYSTAQRGVIYLEEAQIIRQVSNGKRDKVYCATEILSILEEPVKLQSHLDE